MSDQVFDFDENWDIVVPHLNNPLALRALKAGMEGLCDRMGRSWNPAAGPWILSEADHWSHKAKQRYVDSDCDAKMWDWCDRNGCPSYNESPHWNTVWNDINEKTCNAEYDRLVEPFWPQSGTFEWYQCYGGCHWIVAWNCVIGQLIFPDMAWSIIKGANHSTAFGIKDDIRMFMDILWFNQAGPEEIWSESQTADCEIMTLIGEVEWLETRPYRHQCGYCGGFDIEFTRHHKNCNYKEKPFYVHLEFKECRLCGHIEVDAEETIKSPLY